MQSYAPFLSIANVPVVFPSSLHHNKKNLWNQSEIFRGDNQIWTGDQGVADPRLTTWLCRHTPRVGFEPTTLRLTAECSTAELSRMTPTGIEPVLPPWKGDVLTAWPRSHMLIIVYAVPIRLILLNSQNVLCLQNRTLNFLSLFSDFRLLPSG